MIANVSFTSVTEQHVTTVRRPTGEEVKVMLIELANRLERQGNRVNKAAVIDDHQKAGLAAYLKTEASNIRELLARAPRVMD